MATIWPAPGGGSGPVAAPENLVADPVDAMVSFG
jgi:hypothetical protein